MDLWKFQGAPQTPYIPYLLPPWDCCDVLCNFGGIIAIYRELIVVSSTCLYLIARRSFFFISHWISMRCGSWVRSFKYYCNSADWNTFLQHFKGSIFWQHVCLKGCQIIILSLIINYSYIYNSVPFKNFRLISKYIFDIPIMIFFISCRFSRILYRIYI